MKKILITWATGMVGSLVLQYCLADDTISEIISFSRRSTGLTNTKLREIIISDFLEIKNYEQEFINVHCAFFCLWAYTWTVSDDVFKTITVDYTNAFIDLLNIHSPDAIFSLLSGAWADQTETSWVSFAKYKGIAENYARNNHAWSVYFFRPWYIYPATPRKEPNRFYAFSAWLYPYIERYLWKNMSIRSEDLARGIYLSGLSQPSKQVLENKDILDVVDQAWL